MTSIGVTVFERQDAGAWQAAVLTDNDVMAMPEIGVTVTLAELYAGIELAPEDPSGTVG